MATTITKPVTFEDLARRHGKALAYIAGQGDDFVPAPDPASVDVEGLIELVSYASFVLSRFRREEAAESLASAEKYLTEARDADDADRPGLLKRAARDLSGVYDTASELAIDLGEDRNF